MKFRIFFSVFAAALALSAVSCSDDDDDTTSEYLDGSFYIEFPSYVKAGFTKEFCLDTLQNLSRSDGGAIGFYVSYPDSEKDTLVTIDGTIVHSTFTITAPEDMGSSSFMLAAFVDGDYYGSTSSVSFTVIQDGLNTGSLTGYRAKFEDINFTDGRDGKSYLASKAPDGSYWMRQNLAWEGAGQPYQSSPQASYVFGRYYSWNEALTACPDGWHLPSEAEFASLCTSCGADAESIAPDIADAAAHLIEDISFHDSSLWEYWPAVQVDNKACFSALPFGYAVLQGDSVTYGGAGSYAAFWTSDEASGRGVYRYIYEDNNTLFQGLADKESQLIQIRCVRD